MDFGTRVKQRRLALGLTQQELARKIGCQERYSISVIENGRPVGLDTVERLAIALDVTPSYLMGWADENGNEIVAETPLERLKREVGVTDFTEEEKKEIIQYIKFIISQR